MYRYDEFDHTFMAERVKQFSRQVDRRVAGEMTEDQFKPLRLMNGLYLQLHAYMLRVNVPYGSMSATQLRGLADIARKYDRDYGHFTTRQNIQFNWIKLEDMPAILSDLAKIEMHGIQSSGNCIRNTTSDHYAGAAADEIEDPRVYCEIIRQWSTLHPEFSYLPRKFKIAVTGAPKDRAAVALHDIGLRMYHNNQGKTGFEVLVGGGQGRTPVIGKTIREWLEPEHLLSYLEAILRVYNLWGRRDNKYKARIKILVNATGIDEFRNQVEAEWADMKETELHLDAAEVERINAYFAPPAYEVLPDYSAELQAQGKQDAAFQAWLSSNTAPHKVVGYSIANLSLKGPDQPPGDMTAAQMDATADLADRYNFGELRVNHRQNLTFTDVRQRDLYELWQKLMALDLATPNIGKISDIIACPGLDYCALANARSIPIAERIQKRFEDIDRLHDVGEISLNISGCMNACGHHHVGNIGILGVEKKGQEYYQFTLGGSSAEDAALGDRTGRGFPTSEVVDVVEKILNTYIDQRDDTEETFLETYRRVGMAPFKEALYGAN